MASNASPRDPAPEAAGLEEQKPPLGRRNMSRSEEDDSDDSGVIKDVSRRNAGDVSGGNEQESEIALGSGGESSTNTSSEQGSKHQPAKVEKPPNPKKSYLDFIEQKPARSVLRFSVGDLVWGRMAGSYFHPGVVTMDPHFK